MSDDFVYPMRHLPGRALPSGFEPLPPAEQEKFRRQHAEMMRRLEPFFRDVAECQRRAAASALTSWVG